MAELERVLGTDVQLMEVTTLAEVSPPSGARRDRSGAGRTSPRTTCASRGRCRLAAISFTRSYTTSLHATRGRGR